MKFKTIIAAAVAATGMLAPLPTIAQKVMTPPHVLVVPDLMYCKKNGYTQTFDENGTTVTIPDYERAINEDATLHNALIQVQQLINERNSDIVLVDLNESINNAKKDMAISSANDGNQRESIEQAIIRNSNSDIIIKVNYDLLRNGPEYNISYSITGTDSYTANMFAPFEGIGKGSTSANPVLLLREALYDGMDDFIKKILTFYSSMKDKGRMVAFNIETTNSSVHNMNSILGTLSLREVIDDFLYDNSIDGGGTENVTGGDTFLQYKGVYIPLVAEIRGRTRRQGAKDVAQRLTNHLATLGVTADFKIIGLGKVNIFIR